MLVLWSTDRLLGILEHIQRTVLDSTTHLYILTEPQFYLLSYLIYRVKLFVERL